MTGGSVTSPLGVVRSSYDRIAGQVLPVDPQPVPAGHGTRNPVESWDALRERLRDAAVPIAEVDAIWVWLIERSRIHGQDATLVCACLAEPMLAKTASAFATPRSAGRHDIESEILTGFLTHLGRVELERPGLWHRLRWAAYRAAIAAAEQHASAVLSATDLGSDLDSIGAQARVMVSEPGHPETVLAQAVAAGVITGTAAELIAVSRWEHRSLTSLAAEREQSVWALRKRRRRAERALLAWLTERALDLDRTSVVEAHAVTALERTDSLTAAPPRRGRRPRPDSSPAPARTSTEQGQVRA
ncbi:hypothetical protein [Nocardia brasiliensis]|uniref:hypothetical protein n=1 Tax=Nocardia brasiliensis TaxID=37326 RepID=UPI002458684E|nr:hypothetical protein [Nocardia brasiliensis]